MRVLLPSRHSKSKIQRITTRSALMNTGRTQRERTDFARESTLRSCATRLSRPTRGAALFSRIDAPSV